MKKVNTLIISNKQVSATWQWQKTYGVWLDWGVDVRFSNKKEAVRFRAFVNRRMTEMVFELSEIMAGLYAEYRRAYFGFEKMTERKILFGYITDAEYWLSRVVDYSEKHGVSLSTVNDCKKVCGVLERLCEHLAISYKKKNRFTDARLVAGYSNRLGAVVVALGGLPGEFKGLGFNTF